VIGREIAEEGTALLSTAIAVLFEDAHQEAVMTRKGDWSVRVARANRFKAVGSDVLALAEAMAVLARLSEGEDG
jgi:hypothetical protein